MAGRQVAWSEIAKVTVRWVRKDKIKFKIKRGWVDRSTGRRVDGSEISMMTVRWVRNYKINYIL